MAPKPHRDFLGPGDAIGEGDCYILYDFLPRELADVAFDCLRQEVKWNKMMHRGGEVPRLVAVEGQVLEEGSYPTYRHPSDESPPLLPFSPTVERIRQHVEAVLHEPVNHVLIQHYRSGADHISEHSDKTIDVVRGSKIVNVSLGAQRIMTLRTKKDVFADPKADLDAVAANSSEKGVKKRTVQRVPLPHNSIFVMGLDTNAKWMHSIRPDKRPISEKTEAELYNNGERISLTFRTIGTFLTQDESHIYGQGAKGKTRVDARPVVRAGEDAERLLGAFGAENHQSDFDWDANYGEGFDVLHFRPSQE
ncbi:hypothetical protein BN946_scf185033.g49 [Trametes cinnabarina]|uniref:Fe2OG dioxygenase domain-containing protein n=1 Tax=Pycnoporus cinnabarinus TaxID=5643 RepID=A0A060SQQ5_PYCCI|nr:hypothetical protein BN946_scf185033.g49 [Trametes cinnabarina]